MKRRTAGVTIFIIAMGLTILLSRITYADSTWTVYNQTNSPLPSDYVSFIDFDISGNQYIGTSGWGLVVKRNSTWDVWNQSSTGVPIDAVRLARRDQSASLWLAAASGDIDSSPYGFGVARLDGLDSTWSLQNLGLEVNQTVTGIILNGQARYVSTYGGGITIYDDLGWIRYRYNSRTEYTYADNQQRIFNVPGGTYISSDYIRAIDFDPNCTTLWIATANGGAVKYDGATWATFKSNNSGLPSNQILSVNINKENGKIAFGTAGFGLAILEGSVWTVYNAISSPMTNGFISTLEYRPRDGELWIGTGYGVWVLQSDGQWRGYIPPNDNFIWGNFYSDISFDSVGSVWVSAYGGGIASLFLDSIPSPPPQDTLSVVVKRMTIYFYENRPVERIFTDLAIDGASELAQDDTISFRLDSDLGELYSFRVLFGDFTRGDCSDTDGDYDKGDEQEESDGFDTCDTFRYRLDGLMIFLRYDGEDSTKVEMSIKDFDAGMNRQNYQNELTLTLGLGDAVGICDVSLAASNGRRDDDELFDEDNVGLDSVQVFELAGSTTAVDDKQIPNAARISVGNYPNPFNGNTNIGFDIPSDANVSVTVFDMLGRTVDKVYSGFLNAGHHSYSWPRNNSVKTGIYIYRISIGGQSISKKMMYLK